MISIGIHDWRGRRGPGAIGLGVPYPQNFDVLPDTPHPLSVNKYPVFNEIRQGLRCMYLILLEFAAEIRKQRGYGRFCG